MPKGLHEVSIDAFVDKINGVYKASVVDRGNKFKALDLLRFSSGILSLDLALGGGWPFSRICMVAGNESTGKTLMALKAVKAIEEYCRNCRKVEDLCECGDFVPCSVLFIDLEGSFDIEWAKIQGFNVDYHVVARPEYAEQAIDIIDSAIRDNSFDLIIVDSIAAMTPSKEIEASSEDWQMGLAARLINKAMRRWNASLNKLSQDTDIGGPCVLCLNQVREKIGVLYGDPRVLPGGKAQLFATSLIMWTKSSKIEDDPESKETALVELGGSFKKNKTAIPGLEFVFKMALRDTDYYKIGEVNNDVLLVKLGKRFGIVQKIGGGIGFDTVVCKTEKEFRRYVKDNPEFARSLWRAIVQEGPAN